MYEKEVQMAPQFYEEVELSLDFDGKNPEFKLYGSPSEFNENGEYTQILTDEGLLKVYAKTGQYELLTPPDLIESGDVALDFLLNVSHRVEVSEHNSINLMGLVSPMSYDAPMYDVQDNSMNELQAKLLIETMS
jgi:hypothetical protein